MPQKILNVLKNNYLLTAFMVLGLMAFIMQKPEKNSEEKQSFLPETKSVDTYIPRGFVLVPIELANAESLHSLVGDMGGVVDLYLASGEKQKGGLKVGAKLKLVRAPLNPEQYAVLVPDAESSQLLSFPGPFIAVIQNPEERGTKLRAQGRNKIKVEYQNN